MKHKSFWLMVSGVFWIVSCVQPQQIDLIEREQRRLRGDTGQVQASVETLRTEVDSVRSSLADTRANLQQLQREFGALRERIEETRYQVGRQLGQNASQGDQRVKDLELRVAKLDDALKAQAETLRSRDEELNQLRDRFNFVQGKASDTPGGDVLTSDSAGGESAVVKRDYEIAWHAMEKRDFRLAILRFKEFLKRHSKSNLADNAQYWIGESHYGLREFDQAIIEFDAVRRRYPQGEKVAAALLKQGYAFAELGEKVNARLLLQEVVEKFPDSPEAAKAKMRLKSLES